MTRLSAIAARVERGTRGPWRRGAWTGRCHKDHGGLHPGPPRCEYQRELADNVNGIVAGDDTGPIETAVTVAGQWGYEDGGVMHEADAAFIAASREDVPYLLQLVARKNGILRELLRAQENCIADDEAFATDWFAVKLREALEDA